MVHLHGRGVGPIDQAYTTTQAPERADILNVGGFSDAVFSVVVAFLPDDSGRFVAGVEMIPHQRTLGGGNNQIDHHWRHAPHDTFAALGHGSRRGLAVIPSLDLVLSWNDSRLNGPKMEDRAPEVLVQSVNP